MNKKSLKDINIAGKRVLMRVDFNVPLDEDLGITVDGLDILVSGDRPERGYAGPLVPVDGRRFPQAGEIGPRVTFGHPPIDVGDVDVRQIVVGGRGHFAPWYSAPWYSQLIDTLVRPCGVSTDRGWAPHVRAT